MRILLDENMPRKLQNALVAEGHEVHSVRSLQLDGIDNGALYELGSREYDFCFTRDAEFANRVRESGTPTRLKLLRVLIPQTRQEEFVGQFIALFDKRIGRNMRMVTIGRNPYECWIHEITSQAARRYSISRSV